MISYQKTIKRVAIALIAVGIVDIAFIIFWLAQGNLYISSFNIFAVIGGICLLKNDEDFQVIEKISVFSGFFFGAVLGLAMAIPFSHSSTYWQKKLLEEPFWLAFGWIQIIFLLSFSSWVFLQLTSAPVKRQRLCLGLNRDRSIWGLIAGIVLGLISFIHAVFY